jgi:hypothetical protein
LQTCGYYPGQNGEENLFINFNYSNLRDIPASFLKSTQQIVELEKSYSPPTDMRQTRSAARIIGRYFRQKVKSK